MDVDPTDLMILFDDFDKKVDQETNQIFYFFICERNKDKVEFTIFPQTKRASLILKSTDIVVSNLNFENCDFIKTNLKEKKMTLVSGYDELSKYIRCQLSVTDENLLLILDANYDNFLFPYTDIF